MGWGGERCVMNHNNNNNNNLYFSFPYDTNRLEYSGLNNYK